MKKAAFIISYLSIFSAVLFLGSCQDDPITPNDPNNGGMDSMWYDTNNINPNGGGNPFDSTGGNGNPIDSSGWNGNSNDSLPS
jgi:hypothetical protein